MSNDNILFPDGNKKQCMGCMEFYGTEFDICPHCGYAEDHVPRELFHMPPGTVLANRYIVGRAIGYGGFGVTYIGWDTQLKRKIAVKEYLPSEFATRMIHDTDLTIVNNEKKRQQFNDGMKKFLQEGKKLARVSNIEGIVYMHDCFESNNTAYITMEYLEGETLSSYLAREGTLSEQNTMELMMPVLQALEEVHERGIIHRDIAPDNIFLAKKPDGSISVKLIDFGAAKFATTSHSKSLTVIIKPGYSPEEQYRSNGEQGVFTDVYAIAAVMYKMVTGVQPPDAFERRTFIESKKKDPLEKASKFNKDLSYNFEVALHNAMNVKVEDRTETVTKFVEELISYEKVAVRGPSIKMLDFGKWPRWAKIGVPTGGAAAVVVVLLAIFWVFSGPASNYTLPDGMTRVPDFVTASIEEAQEWANDANILIASSGTEYVPNVVSDLVLSQDTPVGLVVVENTPVNVIISTGEEIYTLPDVSGMTEKEARAALECMGLEVLVVEGSQPGLANGCVITQDITAYSNVKNGETITLTIASNSAQKSGTVPNVVGMEYEQALEQLGSLGIGLTVTQKTYSEECDSPQISKQSIKAGETISDKQTLEVAVVLPMREFKMPNLLYKKQDTAVQLLENLGIKAIVNSVENEVVAAGHVASQSVDKEQTIKPGQEVVLSVSKGGKPVEMVDVRGLTSEEARQKLAEQGLVVTIEYKYVENVQPGNVISQSVKSGTSVSRGESVTIVVCSQEGLISVENVVGKDSATAKETLSKQGFKVQINEIYSEKVAKGKVIEQLPKAGTVQQEGSTVVLNVSKGKSPDTSKSETSGSSNASWSEWTTSLPAGVDEADYIIDTKTQYRYRTRVTCESSEPNLQGWTLYDSKSTWGEYGNWSSWSTTAVSESDSTKVEKKTQYSYRDKKTTTSTKSSLSGWTQSGSTTGWSDWGNWSAWTTTAHTASDSKQVNTRKEYRYYVFYCPVCGGREPLQGKSDCGNYTLTASDWIEKWSKVSYADSKSSVYSYTSGKRYTSSLGDGKRWNFSSGNLNSTAVGTKDTDSSATVIRKTYQYRTRSKVTTYSYWKWGDWSSYSDTVYTKSDTRQVKTRVVYRSKTRDKNTTYYYEQWGDWSSYSNTEITGDSNTEVGKRVLYRYKKK